MTLDALLACSRTTLDQGSKSFAKAARLFAPPMRDSVTHFYAWCRYCDDVIDGQTNGSHALQTDTDTAQALAALRHETQRVYDYQPSDIPAFQALARVVATHQLPHRHIDDVLQGFALDVTGWSPHTITDTLVYCYHVAGVIGLMMARIMGVTDPAVLDRACDLGLAFQLTNIARDMMDDGRAGRCYIPDDWLQRAGLSRATYLQPAHRQQLHALAVGLVDLAEPYYASAKIGVRYLPFRAAWAVCAALLIYRAIGLAVRAGGPAVWDRRVVTGRLFKAVSLLRGFIWTVSSRLHTKDRHRPRSGLWTPER